jgi:hypothetical protein
MHRIDHPSGTSGAPTARKIGWLDSKRSFLFGATTIPPAPATANCW